MQIVELNIKVEVPANRLEDYVERFSMWSDLCTPETQIKKMLAVKVNYNSECLE